jgi:hypothetical protein
MREQVAIMWEGDEPNETRNVTYREAHRETCRLANVLLASGANGAFVQIFHYRPVSCSALFVRFFGNVLFRCFEVIFGSVVGANFRLTQRRSLTRLPLRSRRRAQRRYGGDLHAKLSRGCIRHVGVRAYRCATQVCSLFRFFVH